MVSGRRLVQVSLASAAACMSALTIPHVLRADAAIADVSASVSATDPATRLATLPFTVTGSGIGTALLGQRSDVVIPTIERRLGPVEAVKRIPLDLPILRACFGGTELITATWSGATLRFVRDEMADANGAAWFDFFIEGRNGRAQFETSNGARVGDPVERWAALHPDVEMFPGEPDLTDPSLELADGLIAVIDPERGSVDTIQIVSQVFCE